MDSAAASFRADRAVGAAPRLESAIDGILNRHAAVGLAVGVIHDGRCEFHGRGVADIASNVPVTGNTVFRIASLTKLFTAIAVMQLWEQGSLDLDAPANDYLGAYRLVAADAAFPPATVRQLLTHTSGVPEVLHLADLLHPSWGPFGARPAVLSVRPGESLPSPAAYYRSGLQVAVEPGTVFTYTNHGFTALGQIVEDVSGQPLGRYLHGRIFEPLGMADTVLGRCDQVRSPRARGYVIGRGGVTAVADRDWVSLGASNIFSTPADMSRFVAALLAGGAGEHGSILRAGTLTTMYEPHFLPDPRLPGMGLGFFRVDDGGLRAVEHQGVLPGFDSHLLLAPDDGVGIVAITNGSAGAFGWLPIEFGRLLRDLLGVAEPAPRSDLPHHPENWAELCGRYRLPRGSDLRGRAAMGGGVEVFVRGGRLVLRVLTAFPPLYRGLPLQPDDPDDPYVFRLDLSRLGMASVRVVFGREPGVGTNVVRTHLGSEPMALYRRHRRRSSGDLR